MTDTVRSMSKHKTYQLVAIRMAFRQRYGTDPYNRELARALPDVAELPADMRGMMPDQLSPQMLAELDLDPDIYKLMYVLMNAEAERAMASWPPGNLYRLRYEDLRADPAGELAKLGEFFEFADPAGWADQVAEQVRPPSRPRSAQPA
jgi:putative sulfotransferase